MDQQILFNDSNLYLQDTSLLKGSIGFVNPLHIDTYVKTSFLSMADYISISGGYIQSFNKDHLMAEMFNYYNIKRNDNQSIINSLGTITFDLENSSFFSGFVVTSIIQAIPIFTTTLIIMVISFLLPQKIANFFRYLSLLGMLITAIFYFVKLIKIVATISKFQGIDYNGINVKYENSTDIMNVTPEYIELLKQLKNEVQIKKIVIANGQIYLKQRIKYTNNIDHIKNIFTGKIKLDEQENLKKIQDTILSLNNNGFIGAS